MADAGHLRGRQHAAALHVDRRGVRPDKRLHQARPALLPQERLLGGRLARHGALAVGESSVSLMPPPLFIPGETPTKGTGRVPSNDSLADG